MLQMTCLMVRSVQGWPFPIAPAGCAGLLYCKLAKAVFASGGEGWVCSSLPHLLEAVLL